ncbi:MAG TPA: HD domain-containing protein [Aliidongia sp.]|nr:HD domain-containing protein [Aliidongia sp.]
MTDLAEIILALFERRGADAYSGEAVTQQAHALQCAALAEAEGAGEPLVLAALLHDIGHLVHDAGEDVAARGIDARHEAIGAVRLARHFGPAVVEPVRLHVPAKRYLCATDAAYYDALSPASKRSLALQGGPFTASEAAEFEVRPHARDAVRLRRWDDLAKVPDAPTKGLGAYRALMLRVAASAA